MNPYTTWRFHALDTWFFREARPFDTIGSPELGSQFPPPAPTVAGAIKTLIGRQRGADWDKLKPDASPTVEEESRLAELGRLQLCGPFLCRKDEPLFPAPLFLLAKKKKPEAGQAVCPAAERKPGLSLSRLRIGDPVETDLGIVRLPELPKSGNDDEDKGYKPLENAWLTGSGLQAALNGGELDSKDIFQADELFTHEPRLGIGRNNETGTAADARLYTTRHVRPRDDVGLMVGVAGLPSEVRPEPVRLGGEGRLALVDVAADALKLPSVPEVTGDTYGLILILLTPADLDDCWRLPKSEPVCPAERDSAEAKYWRAEVNGVRLKVYSAVLGKPRREGGWHLAERKPRRVDSFVPAGSAWYCEVEGAERADTRRAVLEGAIKALHLKQIGGGQRFGRGLLAVGLWRGGGVLAGPA
jgi:CRISPR-associated protein Cmr3